jgi:hypothetical protein
VTADAVFVWNGLVERPVSNTYICSYMVPVMTARFALAVPDDPDLLARLTAALSAQGDPPIMPVPSGQAVVAFESVTGDMMLRSRVVQALEAAVGPGWQTVVVPLR